MARWKEGDLDARNEVVELMVNDIKRIAHSVAIQENPAHRIDPTELMNESMLRMLRLDEMDWQDRHHFLSMSARVMRQTLVDQARKRRASKRDGEMVTLVTQVSDQGPLSDNVDLIALDEALNQLEEIEPERADIVQLKYFVGLSNAEIAEYFQVSESSIERRWRVTRSWLSMQLSPS